MSEIRAITAEEFETVVKEDGITLIKFYTQGCPACARFAPTYGKLADEYEGRAVFLEMDARQNLDTAKQLGIRGVPTVVAFRAGSEAQRVTGAKTLAEMREWLAPVLS